MPCTVGAVFIHEVGITVSEVPWNWLQFEMMVFILSLPSALVSLKLSMVAFATVFT
jgi:hypothetical protein